MSAAEQDLLGWSAGDVLAAFRDRRLSPVEYLQALIARIEEVQPTVNCLGDTYFDEALDLARKAAQVYATDPARARPLEGLPVVVKDETEVAGKRTTNGSLLYVDYVAEESDPIVERLTGHGAIVHARGLTPEFSITFWTHSRLWGVTRNPWNPAYDVSGSSGGPAAALAAGMTPLATGSDIGGSIRTPASCCGVVGYLPPHGRIPVPGVWGRDDWSRVGPLARSVSDCALVTDLVSGHHVRDHFSIREPSSIGVPTGDVRGWRVAVSYDLGDWPVTDEVRAATRDVVEALAAEGADVVEVDLVMERELVRRASNAHNGALFAASLTAEVARQPELVNDYTHAWLDELAADQTPTSVFDGRQIEAMLSERVDRVLTDHRVLICPVMAMPAFEAGADYSSTPFVLDGVEWDVLHDLHLTEAFNLMGRTPVLVVPAGRSSTGVPIGVQIVGRTYDDASVMTVGAALERARPWSPIAEPAVHGGGRPAR